MYFLRFTMGDTLSVRALMSSFHADSDGNLREKALDRQWRPIDLCGIMSISVYCFQQPEQKGATGFDGDTEVTVACRALGNS